MATLQETKKPRTLKEKLLHTGKRIALEKERYILILPGLGGTGTRGGISLAVSPG